jgi:DNA ligase-1
LDGVRAYWNGQKLICKHAREIPTWFVEELPTDVSLDGELFLGPTTFEMLNFVLRTNKENPFWKQIRFMVYDIPNSKQPYEIRVRDISNLKLPDHVHVLDITRCRGNEHLHETLGNILQNGGQGLVANKYNSFYMAQTVDTLVKVKVILSSN